MNTRKLYERMKEKFECEVAIKEFYENLDQRVEANYEPKSGLDLNEDINYYYEWSTD